MTEAIRDDEKRAILERLEHAYTLLTEIQETLVSFQTAAADAQKAIEGPPYEALSDEQSNKVVANLAATPDATLIHLTMVLNRIAFESGNGRVKTVLAAQLRALSVAFHRFAPAAMVAADEIQDGEHEPLWPDLSGEKPPPRLWCVECGATSTDGRGWRTYVIDRGDVATFCASCSAREFGGDDA